MKTCEGIYRIREAAPVAYLVDDTKTIERVLCLYLRAVILVKGLFRLLELEKVVSRESRLHEISPTKHVGTSLNSCRIRSEERGTLLHTQVLLNMWT